MESDGMTDRDSAFAEYFSARSDAMRRTAYLLCGDWHRAEDLVQAAFAKVYVAWNRASRHESLDGYVRRTVIRTFLDERRRAYRRRERVAGSIEEAVAPYAPPQPIEDRIDLLQALAEVPPRQRAVLVLRYWEDLSIEETAELLSCSEGTVKSQAARGLATLRALMAPASGQRAVGGTR
jgi:RNA polymerase sigma-70 factor (sigma-E family)